MQHKEIKVSVVAAGLSSRRNWLVDQATAFSLLNIAPELKTIPRAIY